uniref:Uncharacterized protein n=1 Tax=Romanomermis culicivorax TaxID=13658 RepID=A0A915JJ10_ROMCU
MVRLMAHTARLIAQQQVPALRNPMPPTQLSVNVQNAGNCPLGAHLQMCSFHGRCTHNGASCRAQRPNSTGPSNAAISNAGCCYFFERGRTQPINVTGPVRIVVKYECTGLPKA